ncbi:uncharacterized protein TNIN_469281 [Trichonephila inaurata madagascariensis]|uniref:Uncharacterized protein n=1 Tax=Trichonephila inaurata madagascariensis TaxID=2747483 RepID=A0A8X7CH29_9ARAC|nr:uncharacterized protein TNIN_469281 [Trichonephila inaurata madagascariensis]
MHNPGKEKFHLGKKMKLFALLLLVGVASASFHEMLDDASEEFVQSFLEGMENAPSLREHFHEFDEQFVDEIEIKVKKEIGARLREVLNKILERVKEGIEQGKVAKEEIFDKIKELREKLKVIKEDLGEKGHELLEKIKDRARDFLRNLLDKLKTNKRATDDQVEEALAELNIRDMLKKLKEHLKKTIDPELLKEKIEKIFGQGSELLDQLLQTLREKGKRKMLILIDLLLGDDDEDESKRSARGISDYWEKVKKLLQRPPDRPEGKVRQVRRVG